MKAKSLNLCFVGNMLGRNAGYVTTQGQILADLFAADGYEVTCVSSKLNRAARMSEILATLFNNRKKFDLVIVEVYSGASFLIADAVGKICRIFRIPLIMWLHGGNLPEFAGAHPFWTRRVLSYANNLIAPSPFLANKLADYGYKISVISNVIDLDSYEFRKRSVIAPKLFWMRSFHPIYNPQMAIEVLAELKKTVPAATLTMAGVDKGLEAEVKHLAKILGVSSSVNFVGFLNAEQKAREFSAADVYLNTNRVDNTPVSVIEAFACGLPVVATDVGGLHHLIEHGENGFLVENENVGAMVKSVKAILKNPELTEKISTNACLSAQKYAWAKIKKDWEILFAKMLKRKNEVLDAKSIRYETAP